MFVVAQYGCEAVWCKTPSDVAIYLCGLFGKHGSADWMSKIVDQVEKLRWGKELIHEDLSISILHC